jgi:excisionase family DNA binding protein
MSSSARKANKRQRDNDLAQMMTVEQAAVAANVSVATIWRWRNQGVLRGRRVLGRTVFDRAEVEAVAQKRN